MIEEKVKEISEKPFIIVWKSPNKMAIGAKNHLMDEWNNVQKKYKKLRDVPLMIVDNGDEIIPIYRKKNSEGFLTEQDLRAMELIKRHWPEYQEFLHTIDCTERKDERKEKLIDG